jgi:hypothetical protein
MYRDFPDSKCPYRFKCDWKVAPGEPKSYTWEPIEHLYENPPGYYPQVADFHRQQARGLKDLKDFRLKNAQMTSACGVKVIKRVDRFMAGWWAHANEDKFANCKFGSDLRFPCVGMDKMRFRALLQLRPPYFMKYSPDKFEVHCSSDFTDWLKQCACPSAPARKHARTHACMHAFSYTTTLHTQLTSHF